VEVVVGCGSWVVVRGCVGVVEEVWIFAVPFSFCQKIKRKIFAHIAIKLIQDFAFHCPYCGERLS